MKNILIVILAIIGLTACSKVTTDVYKEYSYPKNFKRDDVQILIDGRDQLPDSAKYIGTFETIKAKLESSKDPLTFGQMMWNMKSEILDAGGNCVVLSRPPYKESNKLMQGWVYQVKDYENIPIIADSLKEYWKSNKADILEGLYEGSFGFYFKDYPHKNVQFAIMKINDNEYKMIYLSGFFLYYSEMTVFDSNVWEKGDVIAYIKKTDKATTFIANTYKFNKSMEYKTMMKIDNGNLRIFYDDDVQILKKVYPDSSKYEDYKGALTGFGIANNRIITCFRGALEQDAKIYVKGLNGDFNNKYEAKIEKIDKKYNMAILKIEQGLINNFSFFPTSNNNFQQSDEIFVLGYPISYLMGENVKLTNGNISSNSGLGGDISTLQISAPIQSGNIGSPLFDQNANLIGIVNGGIAKADNVAYALKLKYIQEFLSQNAYTLPNSNNNSFQNLTTAEKVEKLQNNVFLIEVISTLTPKQKYDLMK